MKIFSLNFVALAIILHIQLLYIQNTLGHPGTYRSLPSVSDDHYSELAPDGTYRYAYTGVNTYHAEKRLADGTVEGETLVVRPDGVPVKVHYFADNYGYRPQTEVLYSERVVSHRKSKVLVPDVVYKEVEVDDPETTVVHRPQVLLAPPHPPSTHTTEVHHVPVPVPVESPHRSSGDGSINVKLDGSHVTIGDLRGGRSGFGGGADVAVANPSITAIVGPGGHVELRPETIARSGRHGTALSNPQINAIVGAGGSVVLAPSSRASTGHEDDIRVLIPPPPPVSTRTARLYEAPPVQHLVHHPPPEQVHHVVHQPAPERVHHVVHQPAPERVHHVVHQPAPERVHHVVHHPPAQPALFAPSVRGADSVVIVPPSSKYSYTYSYSAPDGKHPERDNSAFVSVNVNHRK